MARGALKMARERLVANVKGGQFDPRAIFFRFAPSPPPVNSLFGDSLESFETVASPQMVHQALGTFFGPRPKVFEKHCVNSFTLNVCVRLIFFNSADLHESQKNTIVRKFYV